MQVKVAKTEVGFTITPVRKNGHPRHVGTAIISNARIRDGVITGELLGEYVESHSFDNCEIPKSVKARMKPVTVVTDSAKVVYAGGKKLFYLP